MVDVSMNLETYISHRLPIRKVSSITLTGFDSPGTSSRRKPLFSRVRSINENSSDDDSQGEVEYESEVLESPLLLPQRVASLQTVTTASTIGTDARSMSRKHSFQSVSSGGGDDGDDADDCNTLISPLAPKRKNGLQMDSTRWAKKAGNSLLCIEGDDGDDCNSLLSLLVPKRWNGLQIVEEEEKSSVDSQRRARKAEYSSHNVDALPGSRRPVASAEHVIKLNEDSAMKCPQRTISTLSSSSSSISELDWYQAANNNVDHPMQCPRRQQSVSVELIDCGDGENFPPAHPIRSQRLAMLSSSLPDLDLSAMPPVLPKRQQSVGHST